MLAKKDDEKKIQPRNDEVVAGDIQVGLVVHPYSLADGAHIGDTAGIDACGHCADLCKLAVVAVKMAAEQEESCQRGQQHGRQSREEYLQRLSHMPAVQVAGHQHQRDGQRHSDGAEEAVDRSINIENSVVSRNQVGHSQPDKVQHGHRTDFVNPAPSPRRQHNRQRHSQKVEYGDDRIEHLVLSC